VLVERVRELLARLLKQLAQIIALEHRRIPFVLHMARRARQTRERTYAHQTARGGADLVRARVRGPVCMRAGKTWNDERRPGSEAVVVVRTFTPALVCSGTRSSGLRGCPVTGQFPLSCRVLCVITGLLDDRVVAGAQVARTAWTARTSFLWLVSMHALSAQRKGLRARSPSQRTCTHARTHALLPDPRGLRPRAPAAECARAANVRWLKTTGADGGGRRAGHTCSGPLRRAVAPAQAL
jgi:hypothetical protein